MPAITPREAEALRDALELAQQSRAFCERVIRDHGLVRPFSRIREAERLRIQALRRLLYVYGLAFSAIQREAAGPATASLTEACTWAAEQEAGRQRRIAQLLGSTTNEHLQVALSSMLSASELRYLPAYARCGQCRNTAAGGCPDGPNRSPDAPPRRCVARAHQDWLWIEGPE
ncbi:hypothetical protein NZK27_05545 [Synechococcus sp. FGCU-3]|nr:hypothetical protein [Synechococcus sp. FGCU3]